MSRFPLITAHTGSMGHPDHSFESLQASLGLGVDIYEDDIRITRDGIPVLAHDDEVELEGGRRGCLEKLTLNELNAKRLTPFTTLQEMLLQIHEAGKIMNLDIKTDHALEPVSTLIEQMHMREHVLLSGCAYETAKKAARYAPHIRRLLNVNLKHLGRIRYADAINQMCKEAKDTGCFGLNLPFQILQEDFTNIVHSNGLDVYVWTVMEAEDMHRLARWGVDSITTRDPLKLTAVREEMNRAEEKRVEPKAEL
ncbi:glycerophosphodiester phosphodiesterase [Paenibacillus amylolyticus]|uniref:glycerophosphodiester phosphodiesterase n=1 Tax=Paenibacillus amylolyticus TaxID=1451 RepID=UPI003EB88C66